MTKASLLNEIKSRGHKMKHGVMCENCSDNGRGFYFVVFVFGKFVYQTDNYSDAMNEFNKLNSIKTKI